LSITASILGQLELARSSSLQLIDFFAGGYAVSGVPTGLGREIGGSAHLLVFRCRTTGSTYLVYEAPYGFTFLDTTVDFSAVLTLIHD
jgi:hypothetical protein